MAQFLTLCYGLFTLPDLDSDSYWDSYSKPYPYIVLCRSFHIGSDLDPDSYLNGFLNGYCTILGMDLHPKERCPSQIYYISIRGSESESEPIGNFCIVQ